MSRSEQAASSTGASPMDLEGASDLLDLLGSDNEGAPPSGASPKLEHGEALRLKREPDTREEPPPKAMRVKSEEDCGAAPQRGQFASGALVPTRSRPFGASPKDKADTPQPCEGCGRIRGASPDFLVIGEGCVWAHANGRGCWCRDCHTAWRTNFQHLHALAYFHTWLQEDVANRKEFEETLLAHLSLQWEETTKITREMVQQRRSLLKWVWGTINFDPFRGASPQNGCFVREWVLRLSGASPAVKAEQELVKTEADDKGASPLKPRSRLGKRLHGLLPQATKLLSKFGEDNWVELSEAMFTKLVSTLASVYTECGQVGECMETTNLAREWSEAMQAAKSFIKARTDGQSGGRTDGRTDGLTDRRTEGRRD